MFSRFSDRLIVVILLLWCVGTVNQLFSSGFVLDDQYLIVNNRWLGSEAGLKQLLSSDLWAGEPHPDQSSGYYRPIFLLSIWFDHWLWGDHPLGYHLHSLLWSLAGAFVSWRLFQYWRLSSANFAAAIFLLHPLQSEALYWIAARNDTMACTFALLGLWLWASPPSTRRDYWGGFFFLLAFGAKESAFFILPMLVVLFRFKRIELNTQRLWILISAVALFLGLRLLSQPGSPLPDMASWRILWSGQLEWFFYMIGKLVTAYPLASHMPLGWLAIESYHYVGAVLFLVLGAFVWRKSRFLGMMGFICVFSSLITAAPALVQHGLIGDRYLSLAVLGLCFWLGALPKKSHLPLFLVLLTAAIVSFRRGADWSDDQHIWMAAERDYPSSFTAVSLGHIYYNQKNYDLAYEQYLKGFSARRPYLNACDAFVVSALKSKGLLVANEKGSWAVQRGCPLTGELAGAMGVVNIGMREWAAAREMCRVPLPDFYKKKDLVCAAVAYVDGDLEQLESYRQTWSDRTNFDRQLSALLQSGGLNP